MNTYVVEAVDRTVAFAQRITHYFSRLLWRLAFTYIIVTVATFTILLGVLIFINNSIADSTQMGSMLSLALLDASNELAPALSQQPTDKAVIDGWVSRTIQGSTLAITRGDVPRDETIPYSAIAGKDTFVAVVDLNRLVISATPVKELTPGQPLGSQLSAAGQELIDVALSGETNPIFLYRKEKGGLVAAVPIQDPASRETLGAVFVQLPPIDRLDMLFYVTTATLGSGLFITVAAAVIGLIFGILVARGIEKRLKTLSSAVSSWGEGNFTPRITDKTVDEIGLLAQDMNKMADHLENLFQTRQELAALEERNRLARDLHDSVKQQVFAATMNLGAVQALWDQNHEEARRRLDIAASLSRQSQQELTQLIQTLRPTNLRDKYLDVLLKEHIEIWERNNNIQVEMDLPAKLPRLSSEIQEMLYRICQEAFSNIARHSKASSARLVLRAQADQIVMLISDNGRGFDPGQISTGLGLRTMPERLQKLGGSFEIQSSESGTVLTIQAPVPKEENHGTRSKDNHHPVGR